MEQEWKELFKSGRDALRQGRFKDAETAFTAALTRTEGFGDQDPRYALTLEQLADACWFQNNLANVEAHCRKLLSIYQTAANQDDFRSARIIQRLAALYHFQQKYGLAEPLYKQAISILSKWLGSGHPELTTVLDGYADLLTATRRTDESKHIKSCSDAIKAGKWAGGEAPAAAAAHRSGSQPMSNPPEEPLNAARPDPTNGSEASGEWIRFRTLAENAMCDRDFEAAERFWVAAVKYAEKLGNTDQRFIYCLDNLADVLIKVKKYSEAEEHLKRSLSSKKAMLGDSNAIVADTANNLAKLCFLQGRHKDAEEYGKECLSTYERALGSEHPDVAISLHNLATLYHVQKNYQEAETCYARGLAIRKKVLGDSHPDTMKIKKNYADLLKITNRTAEADALSHKATGVITGDWGVIEIPTEDRLND